MGINGLSKNQEGHLRIIGHRYQGQRSVVLSVFALYFFLCYSLLVKQTIYEKIMLEITEIYQSIEGEAKGAGLPFQFIRLTGCNLRCSYCDTKYAYEKGRVYSIKEILNVIEKSPITRVLITGGEPLFQNETPELADKLIVSGYTVYMETNGSMSIKGLSDRVNVIMDIKCPGSGQDKKMKWDNISCLKKTDQVKFVLSHETDYKWAKSIINKRNLKDRCEILFSPVSNLLPPSELASWILRDNLPVRLNLQLQIYIWPKAKRGV